MKPAGRVGRRPDRPWLLLPLLLTLLLAACTGGGGAGSTPATPRPSLAAPRPVDLPSGLELPAVLSDPEAVRGRFEADCAICHGLEGRGDGPRAVLLRPPPADLTDPVRMRAIAPTWLHRSIVEGKGGMPSWGFQYEKPVLWDLTFLAWSAALGPQAGDEALFDRHCAACHGTDAGAATAGEPLDRASRAAASFDVELAGLASGTHAGLADLGAAEREGALRWSWTRLYRPRPPGGSGTPSGP